MAVVFDEKSAANASRSTLSRLVNDETNRSIFYQIVVFGTIA